MKEHIRKSAEWLRNRSNSGASKYNQHATLSVRDMRPYPSDDQQPNNYGRGRPSSEYGGRY